MYDRTAIRTVEVTDRERELRAVALGASAAPAGGRPVSPPAAATTTGTPG
jgi:hypothetical protein